MYDVFVSLTRVRENRLKAKCNALGADYSAINDMLSRMLRWGPELDLNASIAPLERQTKQTTMQKPTRLLYRFYENWPPSMD
jgi:hypothetical protein